MGVNKVILIGNVGKDPEIKHLDSGSSVANFPLATSETYKNKSGEKVTNTEWHNIVIWGKLVDVVEKYVKKGNPLYIEGKMKTRKWTDKDGNDKYTTEVVLEQFGGVMQMLGSKQDNEPQQEPSTETNAGAVSTEEDDLPF